MHGICLYSKHCPRAGAAAVGATPPIVASVTMLTMKGAVQSESKNWQIVRLLRIIKKSQAKLSYEIIGMIVKSLT